MASSDPFGFDTVTGAGVSATKTSKREMEMNDKAKNNVDYKQVRESFEPPKINNKNNARLMNEVAKELERQSTGAGGDEGGVPDKTERYKMIAKINAYMNLPKNLNRAIPKITDRTTDETLKAIIYDLENGSIGGADMMFASLLIVAGLVPQAAAAGTGGRVNLTGLDQNIVANRETIMPTMEELAIKYSHLMTAGPWTGLVFALGNIALDTHKTNTDPEYAKKKAELKARLDSVNPEVLKQAIQRRGK